ncbi:cAMP-specific 3',5'-cyclic phosphodiesterase 4D, partial [Nowakowskiella sp. JEL0078]
MSNFNQFPQLPARPSPAESHRPEKQTHATKRLSSSHNLSDITYALQVEKFGESRTPEVVPSRPNLINRTFGWMFRRRSSNALDLEVGDEYTPQEMTDLNDYKRFRSHSVPTLAFGFSDHESMGDYMEAHILAALKRTSFNRLTMSFDDSEIEEQYSRYFLDRTQKTWWRYAIIAMMLSTMSQALLTQYYPEIIGESNMDYILCWAGGVLPLFALLLTNYFMKKEALAKWIHVISALYLLIMGPIQICGRYFIANREKYPPSLTSPIYILVLVSAVVFFRMRLVATVISMIIAIGVWLGVFGWSMAGPIRTTGDGSLTSFTTSAFAMILAGIVLCFIAFDQERGFRFQYLSDYRFLRINNKLQKQLKVLQSTYTSRIADLDSPLEKAIVGLKSLIASPQISADQYSVLDMIMECLNSPNLLTPDLEHQVVRGQVEVDSEQEKWLFNGIAQRQETVEGAEAQLPRKSSDHGSLPRDDTMILRTQSDVDSMYTPEAANLLRNVNDFNFDIFAFEKATNGNPLLIMANHVVVKSGLLDRLGLPANKFLNFVQTLEAGYHKDLPFHNSLHASDVLHCIHYLSSRPAVSILFGDMELLGIYMAAAMHDFDHPGVPNQFLITTSDPRALRYNDKSVLENHH